MEYWDIYDKNKNIIPGRKLLRGGPDFLKEGEYHLVVHIWIKQSDGRFLISQRTPNKDNPLKWECTGGSVVAGENSIQGALREVREELGLIFKEEDLKLIHSSTRVWQCEGQKHTSRDILDVYLIEKDVNLNDIVFQEGETCNAKFATIEEISEMMDNGEFVGRHHFTYFPDVLRGESESFG